MRPEERRRQAQREAYLESLGPRERARAEDFSFYSDVFPFLPTNVKAYIQSQLGLGSLGGPITELDLTKQELAELDRIIFDSGTIDPNKINYVDYGVDTGKVARPGVLENYVNIYNKNAEKMGYDSITQQDILNNPETFTVEVTTKDGFETLTFDELYRRYGPNILNPTGVNLGDLNDPAFNLLTFLGKADYEINPQGNIVITDTFDFNKPATGKYDTTKGTGLGANPVYEGLRKIPEKNPLASDIPVEINLGTEEEYKERVGKNLGGALLKYYGEK